MTDAPCPLLCVGQILAVHGIKGEVRILAHTADPLAIAGYGPLQLRDGRTVTLRKARRASKGIVATLSGITDRTAAEALCGQELFIPRTALPEPEDEESFYHADLIDLAATAADGTAFGTITAIHDFGAGDMLEILPASGGDTVLIPFTREAVPVVSPTTGTVCIDPDFLVKNK